MGLTMSEITEAELIAKYLEAGGDPDYVVLDPSGKYDLPPDCEKIVMSRNDYERIEP